uniref:Uncharacterized protein n=1 Tax=Craspedostauros australis TaxID=1486917 RepID=A0A7R9ZJS9_9STRA|mmetsp:Transcript_11609/g.32037  ORF Transcript_11609/g.32037 Transcript_11609/m.32037 type:complete len:178 (+) Transcript_11609:234-767(+)
MNQTYYPHFIDLENDTIDFDFRINMAQSPTVSDSDEITFASSCNCCDDQWQEEEEECHHEHPSYIYCRSQNYSDRPQQPHRHSASAAIHTSSPPSPSSPVQRRSPYDHGQFKSRRRPSTILGVCMPEATQHQHAQRRLSGHLTFSTQVSSLPRAGSSRQVQGDCIPHCARRRPSIEF